MRFVVPRTHPSLPGHFPGHPVVPGVVLLELICAAIQTATPAKLRPTTIENAKFLNPLPPDEEAELCVQVEDCDSHTQRARFQALRNGETIVSGALTLALDA